MLQPVFPKADAGFGEISFCCLAVVQGSEELFVILSG